MRKGKGTKNKKKGGREGRVQESNGQRKRQNKRHSVMERKDKAMFHLEEEVDNVVFSVWDKSCNWEEEDPWKDGFSERERNQSKH